MEIILNLFFLCDFCGRIKIVCSCVHSWFYFFFFGIGGFCEPSRMANFCVSG